MAAKDFTANQIRTAKLILTGGIGVGNLGLSVYSGSLASDNTGTSSDSNMYSEVGGDVTVFISGSGLTRGNPSATGGTLLVGGDLAVSGTIYASGSHRHNPFGTISGSIHRTRDGLSYLVAGAGMTISSGANGQVTFATTAGADQNLFSQVSVTADGGSASGGPVVADATTDTLTLTAGSNITLTADAGADSITIAAAAGSSEWSDGGAATGPLYPAGNTGAQDVVVGGQSVAAADILLGYQGNAVFNEQANSQDFRVESKNKQHALFVSGNLDQVLILSGGSSPGSVDEATGLDVAFYVSGSAFSKSTTYRGTALFGGDVVSSGTIGARYGLSGSLTRLADGNSYIEAGSNITVTSASNGSITIAASAGSSEWTRASSPERLYPNTNATTNVLVGGTTLGAADIVLAADGGATFNSNGAQVDFRVETDNRQGAIMVDGGADVLALLTDGTTAADSYTGGIALPTDISLFVSGANKAKKSSTTGVSVFEGDLVSSGTFFADSIDAGTIYTFGRGHAHLIVSSSQFPFFQNLADGEESVQNFIPHYEVVGNAGSNKPSYGFMLQVPESAKGMAIIVRGRAAAGSGTVTLNMSGAFQPVGTVAPTAGSSNALLGSKTVNTNYIDFLQDIKFSDMGLSSAPGNIGLFAVYRTDNTDNVPFHILSTVVKFRM